MAAVLDPYDRRLLLEALRPPPGFRLDHAIGTTYSLDLVALLSAPLAFSAFAEADTPATDPMVLLEALRASAERITLFCDAGRTYVPPADRLLLAHLEDSVAECLAPLGGAFHPKVWLLRFTLEDAVAFRFLCLSRNLTFDRCWDTSLVLDGRLRGRARKANKPLAEFVRALPGMTVRPLAGERLEAVERLAAEVLRVEWEIPPPFEQLAFHPLGHRQTPAPSPFEGARVDRMLVVSPFTSSTTLERLGASGDGNVLVGRPDQLDLCGPAALERYAEKYVLEDGAVDDGSGEAAFGAMRGLHAKLFVADQGWDATVWTGSANATTSAFERNVEFLVELRGKKKQVGVDRVLRPGSAHEVTLRSLLASYARSEEAPPELEAERGLRRDADELRRRLVESRLQLRVLPAAEEGSWDMALEAGARLDPVPTLAALEVWPITRPRRAGGEQMALGAEVSARFAGLPLEDVTPFVAFRAVLRSGGTEIAEEFVLRLTLLDAPPDRRAHLLRSMLSNRAEVLRYLLYLLSGDGVEAVRALAGHDRPSGGTRNETDRLVTLPLLESLLRTLDRDPAKLAAVGRVVDDLEETGSGSALLPDGWDSIWEPVSAVARRAEA